MGLGWMHGLVGSVIKLFSGFTYHFGGFFDQAERLAVHHSRDGDCGLSVRVPTADYGRYSGCSALSNDVVVRTAA